MPKVLVLSRQSLAKRPLQDWLDEPTRDIVLITSRDASVGSEDVLAEYFPDHRLVDDYSSWSAERVAEEAGRFYGVELVASTSEPDVVRAARLRGRLGLVGQGSDSAVAYRDKLVMKQLARRGRVPVPEFAAVDDPMDLLDFVDAQGFPVVVKPRFGGGASGVAMLYGPGDVAEFLGQQPADPPYLPGQWMVESLVRGDFFHVDGIMRAGEIVHGWPSQYNGGVAEYLRGGSCLSSVLLGADDERTSQLMTLTAEVVAALPAAPIPLAFHCEAWIGADGQPVFCEIASRAGGALVPQTYERAFGVHLSKESLRAQCGSALTLNHQPPAPAPPSGWIIFPAQRGRFAPPAERCPIPGVDLTITMEPGTDSAGLHHVDDTAAGAVVSGETAAQVRERIDLAIRWWCANAAWTR